MYTQQIVSFTHSISAALYDKLFEFCMHWRERQLTCTETEHSLENEDTKIYSAKNGKKTTYFNITTAGP